MCRGSTLPGTVEASDDPRYKPGDKVVLTGWRVGEAHWGGYSQKARVKADWLVPLPDGLDTPSQAMAVGTAGFTAMLAVMALEDHGLRTRARAGSGDRCGRRRRVGCDRDPGQSGLRGGWCDRTARDRGLPEIAGRNLQIVAREEMNETVKRPLESETWAGCVDAVGGAMLARVLGQMKYGASVAAVGLAGGAALRTATVMPFLLRGVNLSGDRQRDAAL